MGLFTWLTGKRAATLTTAQAGPIFSGPTRSGVAVDENSALGLSALWCGLRTISQDVGCLDPHVYKENAQGIRTQVKRHQLERLFNTPNPEMTGITFRETLQYHALLWGNAYAEVVRDEAGNPIQLWPIHPRFMLVYHDSETGQLSYKVTVSSTGGPPGNIGEQITLQPNDVLHVPGLSPDGSVGFRLLSLARETFGYGLATMYYGASLFRNGVRPSGMLSTQSQLGEQARENLRKSYQELHAGSENTGRLMVLEEGITYAPYQFNNEQTQYVELLDRMVFEVSRLLVIPPPKLMSLEQATWANITELNRAYLNDCLRPWLEKWEAECERKLLLPSEQDSLYIEFDTSTLLRADQKTRYGNYDLALAHQPWMTVDEVRAAENMAPLPAPEQAEDDNQGQQQAPEQNVQDTALNGTQIASLLAITDKLATKAYPPEAAKAIIAASFPQMPSGLIASIVDSLASIPEPTPPAPQQEAAPEAPATPPEAPQEAPQEGTNA